MRDLGFALYKAFRPRAFDLFVFVRLATNIPSLTGFFNCDSSMFTLRDLGLAHKWNGKIITRNGDHKY